MIGPIEKHRRRLPHWTKDGAIYFVTFRTTHKELSHAERQIVLHHITSGDGRFYELLGAVVMPDHVHLVIVPACNFDLSQIMKGVKGVSARLLNRHWNRNGTVWQDESLDRILRDESELAEKFAYMLNNPVKQGLVDDGWNWDGWYCRDIALG